MNTPSKRRLPAFTRIELLVVIANIAILAAMLLHALVKAEQKAQRIFCLDQLKRMGIGFQKHADGNGDVCPGPVERGVNAGCYNLTSGSPLIISILICFSFAERNGGEIIC